MYGLGTTFKVNALCLFVLRSLLYFSFCQIKLLWSRLGIQRGVP